MQTKRSYSHTAGPWSLKSIRGNESIPWASHLISAEHGDSQICYVQRGFEEDQNARLIAAAPDLLEALQSINLMDLNKVSRAMVTEAIAKATS